MNIRIWLIAILTVWLFFAVLRQVFDLIGRLWIPVAFNLLQIVCCLTGLFGAIQQRSSLLIAFSISNVISIAQNVLIGLWYFGVFGTINKPVLSAGLPYSFSFFLKHTIGCEAHYDLQRLYWVQSACPIPYYHIEAAQAVLHIFFAFVTFILAIVMVCEGKRKPKKVPKQLPPSDYSQINRPQIPDAPSSLDDLSSGYMNSSYEVRPAQNQQNVSMRPKEAKNRTRPNSMPDSDRYSSNDSESNRRDALYTKPLKKTSSTGRKGGRFKKSSEQRRTTVHETSPSNHEVDSPVGGNVMTSLVSFDPKSGTLLRVREHIDSDEEIYTGRPKERGVDVGSMYERIREKPPKQQPLGETRNKNCSQDSVPSMIAPILSTRSVQDVTSPDSGFQTSSEKWPTPPAKMHPWKEMEDNGGRLMSPGIRLSEREYAMSPGIRLVTGEETTRSAFQIQNPPDSTRVVGHYHSASEIPLCDEEKTPVITGPGLLV